MALPPSLLRWPLTSISHHGRLHPRLDHSTRGTNRTVACSITQNFGPNRIGAGAVCLANSHSSREASNYALATTPAPGDLLPLHASNAPKAHEGKRESTPRASPLLPRRMHTICYGAQQSVGSANAIEGNKTSHNIPSITIELVPARQPTAMTCGAWGRVQARTGVNSIRCLSGSWSWKVKCRHVLLLPLHIFC
jgi:hypothetical protein